MEDGATFVGNRLRAFVYYASFTFGTCTMATDSKTRVVIAPRPRDFRRFRFRNQHPTHTPFDDSRISFTRLRYRAAPSQTLSPSTDGTDVYINKLRRGRRAFVAYEIRRSNRNVSLISRPSPTHSPFENSKNPPNVYRYILGRFERLFTRTSRSLFKTKRFKRFPERQKSDTTGGGCFSCLPTGRFTLSADRVPRRLVTMVFGHCRQSDRLRNETLDGRTNRGERTNEQYSRPSVAAGGGVTIRPAG